MSGGDIPMKRPRRIFFVIFALVLLVIIIVVAVVTTPGTNSRLPGLTNIFSPRSAAIAADEFSFSIGRDRSFVCLDGAVAGAGSLGVQVFDAEGRETLRESFHMTEPAIVQAGGNAIAFDINGNSVRVFTGTEVIAGFEAGGTIVSASINQTGWFTVVTQEGGGSRGTVRVYNSSGNEVYTVTLGSGFVLSAELSHDNSNLAVLNLTPYGSRVTIYQGLNPGDPDYVFDLIDGLIIDIFYLRDGNILALSTDSVILIDNSGTGIPVFTFYGNRLGGYTFNDDFITLHIYDYGLGYTGRIITLQADGTILGEMNTNRGIISMSSDSDLLMVLQNDGLSIFTKTLESLAAPEDVTYIVGASNILALGNNTALATNDHSALVIRLDTD